MDSLGSLINKCCSETDGSEVPGLLSRMYSELILAKGGGMIAICET